MNNIYQVEILVEEIGKLISLLEFVKDGGSYLISIDSSELYDYAVIDKDEMLLKDKINYNFLKRQIALIYLFEELASQKGGRRLYLLPPHGMEIRNLIKSYSYIANSYLLKYSEETILPNKEVRAFERHHIIKKIKNSNTTLSKNEIQELILFLKNNCLYLYSALMIGIRNSVENLTVALKKDNVCDLSLRKNTIINFNEEELTNIREKALTDWLPKINKRRRGNQISTNYIDAMAIEFLYAYNKHFNEKRSVMIHLSKSGLSHSGVFPYSKSKRWFNLPNLKVQGNSLKHEIPIVYNPIAFYIYLVCKEIGDLPSTIRRLKKLLHLNTRIQHSYQEIKDHIKENLNNGLSRQVQKNLATVDNNKKAFENLRLALLFKDDETLKTINMYSKRVEKKKDKILSDFTNRFVKLGKYINENEDLQSALSDFTKNVTKKVYQDIIKTSDLISLRKAVFQKPNPGQYTLSCDDFQTPDIKNIMRELESEVSNKDEVFQSLYDIKFESPEPIAKWEATVLIAMIKELTKEYEMALKDCDDGIEKAPDNLKPYFKFLRNRVLYRVDSKTNLERCIEEARNLVNQYGDSHPRFHIQYGYFLLRGYFNKKENCSLENAYEITLEAQRIAKRNFEAFLNCRRLALANLTIIKAMQKDPDKAIIHIEELDNVMVSTEPIPLFRYAKALAYMEKLDSMKLIEIQRDTRLNQYYISLEEEIDSLREYIINNKPIRFVEKKYAEIISKFDALKIRLSET